MTSRTTIYLVRHAESAPSAEVPEPDWPLSARGVAQAAALVPAMRGLGLNAIYASPYPRAMQTVAPLAAALGMTVTPVAALRERALGRFAPGAGHRELLERCWADPELAGPGGESNAACARRVAPALAALAARHRGEVIAAASHGNALAIYSARSTRASESSTGDRCAIPICSAWCTTAIAPRGTARACPSPSSHEPPARCLKPRALPRAGGSARAACSRQVTN